MSTGFRKVEGEPAKLGYRMPPEWAPHQATWISWPHKEASWPEKFEPVPDIMVNLVAALVRSERVRINVVDEAMACDVRKRFSAAGITQNFELHPFPTNDAWCRDHGAIFVTRDAVGGPGVTRDASGRRELAATRWGYNAWGGKYGPWDLDEQIPVRMAEALDVPLFEGGMILEGGSIDVNGEGVLLTTEQCLLNPNRNPHLSRETIEARLRAYLGVEKILWLGEGIVGDDTDGHVDDITRFVGPRTIVTAVEEDPQDENYHLLRDNLERLRTFTDLQGRPFDIIELPMPGRVVHDDQRLPASYANFYIANKIVALPTYRHANDARAQAILQKCFPDRQVVPIDSWDLIWGLGSFHCLTQQVPLA
jgi:agmatine deiminase